MATFNEFVNVIVPIGVAILFGYLMFKPLREPLSGLFGFIGDIFSKFKRKEEGEPLVNGIHYE